MLDVGDDEPIGHACPTHGNHLIECHGARLHGSTQVASYFCSVSRFHLVNSATDGGTGQGPHTCPNRGPGARVAHGIAYDGARTGARQSTE